MKDTARKKDRSQGTPHIGQLALAAIFEARATQPDLTIDELRERYLAHRQVAVSEPAMRRTVNRMGLSRKKRRSLRKSAKASESSPRATRT
jgi:transposase